MKVKLIIVEPKYQINLGYIARVASNFGIRKLYVVRPRAKLTGEKAKMFAKHAYALLQNAKVYDDFASATRDCSFLIGTSAVWRKGHRIGSVYFADEAVNKAKAMKGVVGIVLGRDDTGLNKEEIEKCDMLAFIGTDPRYPVLNVSHALAIFLYLIKKQEMHFLYKGIGKREQAGLDEAEMLFTIVSKMISKKKIRNKRAVLSVFRKVIRAVQPSATELHALISALK